MAGLDRGREAPSAGPNLASAGVALGAIAGLLVLVVIGIAIAVWLMLDLRRETTLLTDRQVQYAAAVGDIALISKTLANDERGFLISGAAEFRRQWDGRTAQAEEAFSRAYDNASQEQWLAVDRARRTFDEWHATTVGIMDAYAAGERDEATQDSLEEGRLLRKAYEAQLNGMQSLANFAVEDAREEVLGTLSRAVVILLGYLVVALVLGAIIALWLVRRIVRPVQELVAARPPSESVAAQRPR